MEQKYSEPKLVVASRRDIPKLIEIEQRVQNGIKEKARVSNLYPNIYSPTLTEKEWLDELEKAKVFFISLQGQNVGSLILEEKDNHKTLYVGGLVILPEFQGKGIASKILKSEVLPKVS